jgi:hypothetical protein
MGRASTWRLLIVEHIPIVVETLFPTNELWYFLTVKIGQALSIRPDILSPRSMVELQKLCDKVPSYDSAAAFATIEKELGKSVDELFSAITPEPVAAASLGQVRMNLVSEPSGVYINNSTRIARTHTTSVLVVGLQSNTPSHGRNCGRKSTASIGP